MILVFIFNVSLITSMYLACFISGTTNISYAIFSTSYDIFTIYISMSFVFSGSTLHCYCCFLSQITLSGTQTVDSDVSVDRQFIWLYFFSAREIFLHTFTDLLGWVMKCFSCWKLGFPYLGYWASIRNAKWAWYSPKNCLSFLLHCLNSLLKQENCCCYKLSSRNCIMVWIYSIQGLCVSLNILRWA